MVRNVIVVGGGSAGFLAAITLKARLRNLSVIVIRSKDIGIIGVGEGSTIVLTSHLHGYLGIDHAEFFRLAEPQWKLGIKFLWGRRPFFHYSFDAQFDAQYPSLAKNAAYYFGPGALAHTGPAAALMTHDRVFLRRRDGSPVITRSLAYHLENEKFVHFLERYAARLGVQIWDETIREVARDDRGVRELRLESGRNVSADLYIDASGFRSLLLGKTLQEPFVSFKDSLFCDHAVVGGWQRGADEPIKPYTTAETMDAGWCWQIEHEHRINRGYVYSSPFISDEAAEAEFRAKNPKVGPTRIVKFVSGRYERSWVGNVVAVGNASGFVEPLESTSLSFIASESIWLTEALRDADMEVRPSVVQLFNKRVGRGWDVIRQFLALHYRFNGRLDTPFWCECREKTDVCGAAEIVDYYRENGPGTLWSKQLLSHDDQFQMEGYLAMLVGQEVPYHASHRITDAERQAWAQYERRFEAQARAGFTVAEALALVRSPQWRWPTDLYAKLCAPAPEHPPAPQPAPAPAAMNS
jgi:tryptophan halogenase